MYPTQLHSYLLWRSTVEPTARQLAYKRIATAVSLIPATACGLYTYGWYAGVVVAVSMLSAFGADQICRRFIFAREPAFAQRRDGTVMLTGLLVALMLPPSIPLPLAAAGAAIAVLAGKYLLQADAMPLLQPALVGVLALSLFCPILAKLNSDPNALNRMNPRQHWPVLERSATLETEPSTMLPTAVKNILGGDIRRSTNRARYTEELLSTQPLTHSAVHGPRPQDLLAEAPNHDFSAARPVIEDGSPAESYDWARLLLGGLPGTIGASSGLALLLGIAMLIVGRTLSFALPLSALLTMTMGLCMAAWSGVGVVWGNIPIHLLNGATLLTIFYFASDPIVVPRSSRGRIYAGGYAWAV